jgi:5-methylcytosine-specific restriction protein A
MEKIVDSIVFRRMTYADFRHINKVGGEEQGGGGQSYIDFPTANINIESWYSFLGDHTSTGAGNRPKWNFKINNLGLNLLEDIRIYQRRPASISIASQKLPENSRGGQRLSAWHPNYSFPVDYNPESDNLVIYIVKSTDGEYWAGWFLKNTVPNNWKINDELKNLFEEESAGFIKMQYKVLFETSNKDWPFYFEAQTIKNQIKTDKDLEEDLLNQDTSLKLAELVEDDENPIFKETILKIRKRNNKVVSELKKLYEGKCQITGEEFTFKKRNGEYYSEVHHLIPLGESGSDAYANAIVISPLIHRMLHYADVSKIDLSKIVDNKLEILINGTEHTITWLPEHFETVIKSLSLED